MRAFMCGESSHHAALLTLNAIPFDVTLTGLGYSIPPNGALRQTLSDIFSALLNNGKLIVQRYLKRYLAAMLSFGVKPKS